MQGESLSNFSLSQCITEASKRFFTEDSEATTFSFPVIEATDRNMFPDTLTQLTLKTLGKDYRCSFLINNVNLPNYVFEGTTKTNSYIIQIQKKGELVTHIKKLKKYSSWNPSGKFLVFSSTVFKTPKKIATDIIKYLWEENVINVAVLLAETKNNSKSAVYSWYPYKDKNCGDQFHVMLPLDHCWFGILQNNRSWFEGKIPKQLNNCTIKANYIDIPPYVINGQHGFQSSNYFKSQGIEINMLNMISTTLNLNIKYGVSKSWVQVYENGTISGDLNFLVNNSIDILFGAYTTEYHRSRYFGFTWPHLQAKIVWWVPHLPRLFRFRNMQNIFKIEVWVSVTSGYVLISFFIWLLSIYYKNEATSYKSFATTLFSNFGILLGFSVKLPRSLAIRCIMVLLIIFGFDLTLAYSSYLTSIISTPKYVEKFDTVTDIYKHNLKTYFMPNSRKFFTDDDDNNTINGVSIHLIKKKLESLSKHKSVLRVCRHF
ncbi:hypothetical protein NQ314_020655 [Rhamnusium bicolor]|uniref:Uncharacterized protein n=1 Tax=Rhamnusium bicolor TaxID=1586634 RepID=A0AAV8WK23_9CUCU|nr:hypothetical protein NQ314_020655 [Rhamnusium bicolor]